MSGWAVQMMVYAGGDAASRFPGLQQDLWRQLGLLQEVVTNRSVNGVFQLDGTTGPSVRGVLDPSHRFPFEQLGETNTGDPNELVQFISWAGGRLPSERSVLVISGHGLAWQDARARENLRRRGLNLPPTLTPTLTEVVNEDGSFRHPHRLFRRVTRSANVMETLINEAAAKAEDDRFKAVIVDGRAEDGTEDFLDNVELGQALTRAAALKGDGKFDVVVFDACLMSSVEILCELSQVTATVVGAVDEISAAGMNLAGAARKMTEAQGNLSPQELAAAFPQTYTPVVSSDSCVATNVEGATFAAAVKAFRGFSDELLAWLGANPARQLDIRQALTRAGSLVKFKNESVCDLTSLQVSLRNILGLAAGVNEKLGLAVENFRASVIGKSTGSDYRLAVGISCFVPSSGTDYEFNRADYTRLRFDSLTGWSRVLDLLFSEAGRGLNTSLAAFNRPR